MDLSHKRNAEQSEPSQPLREKEVVPFVVVRSPGGQSRDSQDGTGRTPSGSDGTGSE